MGIGISNRRTGNAESVTVGLEDWCNSNSLLHLYKGHLKGVVMSGRKKEKTDPVRVYEKEKELIEQVKERRNCSTARAMRIIMDQYREQAKPSEEWIRDEIAELNEKLNGDDYSGLKKLLANFQHILTMVSEGGSAERMSKLISESVKGVEMLDQVDSEGGSS